jgi:hypothetical protein
MSQNKNNLSAFVRYDGTGRVIAGSLILQKNMPKDGNWKQTQAYLCCDPSCPILVYGVDFTITNIIEELEGITVIYDTAPGVTIQTQLLNCVTGRTQGPLYTIPANTTGFEAFFSTEDLDGSCAIGVRRVCGPSYFSNWIYGID